MTHHPDIQALLDKQAITEVINLYLRDCASNKRQIHVLWTDEKGA